MKRLIYFLPLAFFILLAVMLMLLLKENVATSQTSQPETRTDLPLPVFALDSFKSADIKGYALLHVTASWCAVCKIEHPLLMALSKKLPIYGIAWKDRKPTIDAWLKQAGNPYRKLAMDNGSVSVELGITGTPESFLISPQGRIIAHFRGPLTQELVQQEILERIR